jgi:hypothetical protein
LDQANADEEAAAIPAFQYSGEELRLRGGFSFGRKDGSLMPFANPVSTAFSLQALHWFGAHRSGAALRLDDLI